MTERDEVREQERSFLPLGSVVIVNGSVKKLLIVCRGAVVEDVFYDYGAFLYPEGMIDTNVGYFNHDDIFKVVHEGYVDGDNELALEVLNDAYARFLERRVSESTPLPAASTAPITDLFASVRDLADDDE